MYKYFLLILILLFVWFSGFSQKNIAKDRNHYQIVWESPKEIGLDVSKAKVLSFNNALYSLDDNFLPRYAKKVTIDAGGKGIKALLKNAIYEEMTQEEMLLIKNTSKIGSDITIKSDVLEHKKQYAGVVSFIPIRKNGLTSKYEKLISFDLEINSLEITRDLTQRSRVYAANSVLKTGDWHKISVSADGIYKISYSMLKNMGIDVSVVDPKNIRIYGNGGEQLSELNSDFRKDDLVENAIFVSGESDGVFDANDYVLFYGNGPHSWRYNKLSCPKFQHDIHLYSDSSYYFITVDKGFGKRIQMQGPSAAAVTHNVTTFDDYSFHENENVNFIKSGRQWFGEYYENTSSYNFPFSFPNIDQTKSATVKVNLASRYEDLSSSSNATYSITSQTGSSTISIPEIVGGSYSEYANIGSACYTFIPNSPVITVNVSKQTTDAVAWLDYIEVNVRRQLKMSGGQLQFRDAESVGAGNVSEFSIESNNTLQVWDISTLSDITNQVVNNVGITYTFKQVSDTLKEYVAFDGSSYLTPSYSGTVANQDLHSLSDKDYIIVVHPDFYEEAVQLASFHENRDGLSTIVVTPQQIYNEFSSGSQDISAIRDFVKMFYDKAGGNVSELPQYLLLFGDGSYDNKKRFGTSNTNFIPTYQSENSTLITVSYVSDDFYGLLSDSEGVWNNDWVDIGIGRLPVKSKAEAQAALSKIIAYTKTGFLPSTENGCISGASTSPFGDWRNTICFVADDEDSNTHIHQGNALATIVDTTYNSYNVDKIFLDAYTQESTPGGQRYPGVVEAINKRIEKGCLIFNYTGHGGEVGLAHERVIEVAQINKWKNMNTLPLFFTATCEFSRYDDPGRTSAGEFAFLNPSGGAIALFTTVRLVYSLPNFVINLDFYEKAFTPINGRMPRLGDLYAYMKTQANGNQDNARCFSLLGDPALTLSYPKYTVITDSVNSQVITANSVDTLKALSTVSITGSVKDNSGNVLTGFNGVLYPTVYDKKQNINTLSNDGGSQSPVYNFTLQKNVLYKGKVSVNNGRFKFSFIVPKDISYQFDKGRISYYAENGTEDANGYYEQIVIGGSNDAAIVDETGPESSLYMNDEKFVFGGMTDENPDLYAVVKDVTGVNTVGNGIGHDITATLDGNTDNIIVLNDYYQADLNSYQSGKIRYPFDDLSEGKHSLTLKVWDVYNNSSQTYTEFIVSPSAELALAHVLNYPNPFTTKTQFYFEHNQGCDVLEAEVQIFTVSGKLVKTINEYVHTEGYRSSGIDWDGRDEYGDKIGRGVYLYRVKVKDSNGATAEKFEKLVILN